MKGLAAVIIFAIFLLSALLVVKPNFTGYTIGPESENEEIVLGYCPTMREEALSISEDGQYELKRFGSASGVLSALEAGNIEKALIGRRAKKSELPGNTEERIVESGYTLVSSEKRFIRYSELSGNEIYTHLPESAVNKILPNNANVNYVAKEKLSEKINQGKISLISWDDWKDNFELAVIIQGNKKVKYFRGVFLYSV